MHAVPVARHKSPPNSSSNNNSNGGPWPSLVDSTPLRNRSKVWGMNTFSPANMAQRTATPPASSSSSSIIIGSPSNNNNISANLIGNSNVLNRSPTPHNNNTNNRISPI